MTQDSGHHLAIYRLFSYQLTIQDKYNKLSDLDVYNVLVALDTTKATWHNRIAPIVLSVCASALYKPLHYLFNLCLDFGYLPFEWKVHKVTPIYRSGDHCQIKHYHFFVTCLRCSNNWSTTNFLIITLSLSDIHRSTVQQLLLFLLPYSRFFSLGANFSKIHKWVCYSGKFILGCYMKFDCGSLLQKLARMQLCPDGLAISKYLSLKLWVVKY